MAPDPAHWMAVSEQTWCLPRVASENAAKLCNRLPSDRNAESRGPAHGHVRLHGLGQHDFTPAMAAQPVGGPRHSTLA